MSTLVKLEARTRGMQAQHATFQFQSAAQAGDGGAATIAGYGVGYGEINDYGRVFVPGAFKESLEQDFSTEKPLPIGWMHEIPIGKFTTLRDEQRGPYLEGPISKTSTGLDAAVLVQDGLTALSVGFYPLVYQWAEPNEQVSFETPYGRVTYSFGDYVVYIVKAQIEECSLVLVGADDQARVVAVQSARANAEKALPALAQDGASWEDVAYSMALLMGGRGAAAFEDLPDLEHLELYRQIAVGYVKYGKTAPAYDRHPQYKEVAFQHGERQVFADRYLQKSLRTVISGVGGLDGALSAETREEAERAVEALTQATARQDEPTTSPARQSSRLLLELARACSPVGESR